MKRDEGHPPADERDDKQESPLPPDILERIGEEAPSERMTARWNRTMAQAAQGRQKTRIAVAATTTFLAAAAVSAWLVFGPGPARQTSTEPSMAGRTTTSIREVTALDDTESGRRACLQVLRTAEDPNVRLAALTQLRHFQLSGGLRDSLVAALQEERAAIVQAYLVNALLETGASTADLRGLLETRPVEPSVRRWMETL